MNHFTQIDLNLSKLIELAEGSMGAHFVKTRSEIFSQYTGACINSDGAIAIYDELNSPLNQTFGMGLSNSHNEKTLAQMEQFFEKKNVPCFHEISPYAGPRFLEMLCKRNYYPVELSNVFYKRLDSIGNEDMERIPEIEIVLANTPELMTRWTSINSKAWSNDYPEISEFMKIVGKVNEANKNTECFFATYKGIPASAGALTIENGVAILNGAATLPEMRGLKIQSALIQARLKFAAQKNCAYSVVVVEVGSKSQRNVERNGFSLAYTRTKWCLTR